MLKAIVFVAFATFSGFASALDIGVGLGRCTGGDPSDPYNYCEAGLTAKVFIRHIHMINDHIGVEGEYYHFSHPEKEDLHRSMWMERTWDSDGVSANIFYRF